MQRILFTAEFAYFFPNICKTLEIYSILVTERILLKNLRN